MNAIEAQDAPDANQESWSRRLARHRTGLAALSFAESTVVPIPLETLVVPLMIGHPTRSITIATAIWIGCLVGALTLYAVGYWLSEPVVMPLIEALGLSEEFDSMAQRLQGDSLFWTVFIVSFSPVPMQIATLGAGTIGGNIVVTFAAIALSRALRYYGLAIISQFVGARIAQFNIPTGKLVLAIAAVMVAGWAIYTAIGF